MFNTKQIEVLNQEINSNRIKTRQKGNINLSYLEGFDIIETANRIFGFGNWEYTISSLDVVSQEVNQNQNNVICYKAVVKVLVYNEDHSLKVCREDVGFGTGIARTKADSHEGGAKEAVTDCIKRNFKSFGNQLGLSLYNKSKNHQNNQPQNINQITQQNNYQPQQQSNYTPNNQQNNQMQSNINQPDLSLLATHGITVYQEGNILIASGSDLYNSRDILKSNSFKFNPSTKQWWAELTNNQAA